MEMWARVSMIKDRVYREYTWTYIVGPLNIDWLCVVNVLNGSNSHPLQDAFWIHYHAIWAKTAQDPTILKPELVS